MVVLFLLPKTALGTVSCSVAFVSYGCIINIKSCLVSLFVLTYCHGRSFFYICSYLVAASSSAKHMVFYLWKMYVTELLGPQLLWTSKIQSSRYLGSNHIISFSVLLDFVVISLHGWKNSSNLILKFRCIWKYFPECKLDSNCIPCCPLELKTQGAASFLSFSLIDSFLKELFGHNIYG